jgi:DNA-binding NarL/FixJ family response regulator
LGSSERSFIGGVEVEKLTKRETEVLEKMAQGLKNKEIAEA